MEIQLTTTINFISSKDREEEHIMHSNDFIEKLFDSICSKCHDGLEVSIKGSSFIFDSVQLMYFKCHKVNFKHVGSYIDSPD